MRFHCIALGTPHTSFLNTVQHLQARKVGAEVEAGEGLLLAEWRQRDHRVDNRRLVRAPRHGFLQNSSFSIHNSSFLIQNSSFWIQNSSFLLTCVPFGTTAHGTNRSAPYVLLAPGSNFTIERATAASMSALNVFASPVWFSHVQGQLLFQGFVCANFSPNWTKNNLCLTQQGGWEVSSHLASRFVKVRLVTPIRSQPICQISSQLPHLLVWNPSF